MKRLNFTQENWAKSIAGTKTATRRCHDKARYQVGDIALLSEPTQILETCPAYGYDLLYPWDGTVRPLHHAEISEANHKKLINQANLYRPSPARFMFQSFARHYVEITEVKQELLQDITDDDCIAEGIQSLPYPAVNQCPMVAFAVLWDSINGKKQGKRWGDNPTVIAYGYKYLEGFKVP